MAMQVLKKQPQPHTEPSQPPRGRNPLVNEELIGVALAGNSAVDNATSSRMGGALLLMDAFDRKVSREYFAELMDAVLTMNEALQCAQLVDGFVKAIETDQDGKWGHRAMVNARAQCLTYADTERAKLRKKLELIKEMATEENTIN